MRGFTVVQRSPRATTLIVLVSLVGQGCGDGAAPAGDTTPPAVDLSLSSTTISTPEDISLLATASDNEAVTRVEFYELAPGDDSSPTKIGEDQTPPYEMTRQVLSAAENGSYEFTAKAYDAAGNVGTSATETAAINIGETPAAFAITASHDRITTPGSITFSAEPVEGLSRMEIYEGNVKVGESVGSSPLPTVVVEVGSPQNGSRTYIAKGYGAAGELGLSNTVAILVDIRWDVLRGLADMESDRLGYLTADGTGAAYEVGTIRTESGAVIDLNVALSKYDAEGGHLWSRIFGGTDWEAVYSVGVDQSDQVYISGHVSYKGEGDDRLPDCFLALYDAAGNLLWTRVIGTPAFDGLCVAAIGPAGEFYLSGVVEEGNLGNGRTDVFVTKLDSDGNPLWLRELGSEPGSFGDDILTSIAVDPQGGVYVAGYTSGSMDGAANHGGRDLFVTKYNPEGNLVWSKQFGTSYDDFANALAADGDGGVYVAGVIDHPAFRFGAYGDALLIRYGSSGDVLWQQRLDGGDFDDAWDVAADADAVRLVGRTSGGTSGRLTERTQGTSDAFLATFSRSGDLLDARLLGGPGQDGGTGVASGKNGLIYLLLSSGGGLPGLPNATDVLARLGNSTP